MSVYEMELKFIISCLYFVRVCIFEVHFDFSFLDPCEHKDLVVKCALGTNFESFALCFF